MKRPANLDDNIRNWEVFKLQRFILLIMALSFFGCSSQLPVIREIKKVEEITQLKRPNDYLKTHMDDGTVYIFDSWRYNTGDKEIVGLGVHLDQNRREIKKSKAGEEIQNHVVNMDEVKLVETNDPQKGGGKGWIVAGVIVGVVALYCALDPKACFGSCPTFYVKKGDEEHLVAEGFSSSVMPSLEKRDIDMIFDTPQSKTVKMVVKNEAYETHYIKKANLLAVERKENERVFVTPDGDFIRTDKLTSPMDCDSPSGTCIDGVSFVDDIEYFSVSDPENLVSQEEVLLSFEAMEFEEMGLVIGKRQTLMTTFVLYQTLAYMGKSVSYWISEFENNPEKYKSNLFGLLGGIDVYTRDSFGQWQYEGEINETGPIASDYNIVKLSNAVNGKVDVKLVMNKGLWRLDYLALANITGTATPLTIVPKKVISPTENDENALRRILDTKEYLMTYPGDVYHLEYNLPFEQAEIFLDTEGYYLEWIRDEWIKEQDFDMVNLLIKNPAKYLKEMAPLFKVSEAGMEEIFWNSKFENE